MSWTHHRERRTSLDEDDPQQYGHQPDCTPVEAVKLDQPQTISEKVAFARELDHDPRDPDTHPLWVEKCITARYWDRSTGEIDDRLAKRAITAHWLQRFAVWRSLNGDTATHRIAPKERTHTRRLYADDGTFETIETDGRETFSQKTIKSL